MRLGDRAKFVGTHRMLIGRTVEVVRVIEGYYAGGERLIKKDEDFTLSDEDYIEVSPVIDGTTIPVKFICSGADVQVPRLRPADNPTIVVP